MLFIQGVHKNPQPHLDFEKKKDSGIYGVAALLNVRAKEKWCNLQVCVPTVQNGSLSK